MFNMLSDEFVHNAETMNECLAAAVSQPARSIADVVPDLHPATVTLIDKALQFEKVDRWPNALEMQEALRRGLPVRWPDLDEAALAAIDVQLLWGGYTEQLLGTQTPAVAIVTARREGPDWRLRWTYEDSSTATGWRMQERDLQRGLMEGINRLADEVAAANTIGPGGAGVQRVALSVTGLNSGEDFARVLAYLESLSLVDAVRVRDARPATLSFELNLNAAPRFLEDALQRDGRLIPGEGRMAYRLRPEAAPVTINEMNP